MAKKPDFYYSQAAAVPWRERNGELEVLLITTSKRKRWIIPKGIIDPGRTAPEAAALEAWEEGGVRGEIDEEVLGTIRYKKWGGECEAQVFSLAVTECHEDYPEAGFRKRQWLSVEDAIKKVELADADAMIRAFVARLRGSRD